MILLRISDTHRRVLALFLSGAHALDYAAKVCIDRCVLIKFENVHCHRISIAAAQRDLTVEWGV